MGRVPRTRSSKCSELAGRKAGQTGNLLYGHEQLWAEQSSAPQAAPGRIEYYLEWSQEGDSHQAYRVSDHSLDPRLYTWRSKLTSRSA